ncbi:MAG: hypothetical protein GX096_07460 [Clostridiales bacterium]|nr:hypothetical protein [Clostridiales bacterium]
MKQVYSWAEIPKVIPKDEIVHYERANIVVVGAGHAGTCAARAAADKRAISLRQMQ